jgi:hypothetical protein
MFDPYSAWLKIPAGRRPPTYYELLDLTPREADDPIAVQNAAERRADQLLRHTNGPHAEDCSRVAEEVDAACKTLLDPELRREYDEMLGAATARATAQRQVRGAQAVEPVTPVRGLEGAKRNRTLFIAGGIGVVVVGALVALLATRGKREEAKAKKSTSDSAAASGLVALAETTPAPEPPKPPPETSKKPSEAPETSTLSTAPMPPSRPHLPPDPKAEKLPVPAADAQEKAEKALKETYKKDYDQLRTADDRLALAAKLLQPGREDRKDPAAWFVLLRQAVDLAVQAERPRLAVAAIAEIDEHFTVDSSQLALDALTTIARPRAGDSSAMYSEPRVKTFVSVALGRVNAAVNNDDYNRALQFLGLADEVLARIQASKKLVQPVTDKREEVQKRQKDFQSVVAARDRLKESPDDPAANLVVGSHLACELGKWDEGLPFLGRGSDADLKAAALADLDRPVDGKGQLAVAETWWNYARQNGGANDAREQKRAAYWYEKAAAQLPDGAEKDRAVARVEEVRQLPPAQGFRLTPGGIQGRDVEDRILLLREGGGTMQTEEAVERGLAWIAAHQSPDGGWRTDTFFQAAHCNCPDPGRKHDIAGTAFGLLPLMAAGNTYKQGKYKTSVRLGLDFLARKQARDGSFPTTSNFSAYENALAAIAICEACAMTKDELHPSAGPYLTNAIRAIDRIVKSQSPRGGWGYEPRSPIPDTSLTFWHIWALKSAVNAGVYVPKETFDPMESYLDRVTDRTFPGYWYRDPAMPAGNMPMDPGPRPSLLPVGLLSREMLNYIPDAKEFARSAKALSQLTIPPTKEPMPLPAALLSLPIDSPQRNEGMGIYFFLFSRMALHNVGGEDWDEWNRKTRDVLIAGQDKGDQFTREHRGGSWSPIGEPWMEEGGRLMSTSLAILALEVYYSSVPLNGYGPSVLND